MDPKRKGVLMHGTGRLRTAKLSLLLAVAIPVCLAQLPDSNASAYAAKAITVSGRVSVLKDSQPWAVSVGDMIQVQQLIQTGPDGHAVFQVSDGSTFEVYPNSNVVFRNNLYNWRDLLDLMVGRVRVHIEHLMGQPNPNRVQTPTAVISVRGTTFDVTVDDDDGTTLVEDEEGVVEVQHRWLPDGKSKVLQSGESIRVYRNEPIAASTIDKGTVARYVLRAVMNAVTTMANNSARAGIPGGSVGSGCKTACGGGGSAPTPPPPPPPPPPLH
jgi:ferric-dicitrate binding protein FerR (iron transport regulator)